MPPRLELEGTIYRDEKGERLLIASEMSYVVKDIVDVMWQTLQIGQKVRISIVPIWDDVKEE